MSENTKQLKNLALKYSNDCIFYHLIFLDIKMLISVGHSYYTEKKFNRDYQSFLERSVYMTHFVKTL